MLVWYKRFLWIYIWVHLSRIGTNWYHFMKNLKHIRVHCLPPQSLPLHLLILGTFVFWESLVYILNCVWIFLCYGYVYVKFDKALQGVSNVWNCWVYVRHIKPQVIIHMWVIKLYCWMPSSFWNYVNEWGHSSLLFHLCPLFLCKMTLCWIFFLY